MIEMAKPTLILDEAETFMKENEELRGIVNGGHTKATANVIRTVGESHQPRDFSTWCPKFLALIGRLPATLMDRAIIVPMRRKAPTKEHVEPLRLDRIAARKMPSAGRWCIGPRSCGGTDDGRSRDAGLVR